MRFAVASAMVLWVAVAIAALIFLPRKQPKTPQCVASHTGLVDIGVACADGVCERPVVVQICDRAITAMHN